MNVLNVAAFFVPGLNTVMLGVCAYDLMSSVFTGFEAWEEGDTRQALAQLESLAVNAAVIAALHGCQDRPGIRLCRCADQCVA